MRKIAGPGAVSGAFVDYDAVSNPDGTVYTAQWGNDAQAELVGIQDEFSIAEAAGSNKYVLAAIKGIAISHGKQVGELFYLDDVKSPAEFDKDNPDDFFPGICLDTIDGYTDISSSNWSELVTHLRAKAVTYAEGMSGEKSTFSVTDWAISSNVATLTFESLTAEIAILESLSEDNLVHGSFSNWRSITLPSAIGSISAGEYAITDIDTSANTVSFAFVAADGSGSGSYSALFYTHRVPGSTTTARLFEASARSLVSANDDGECVNGLRKRDRFQGHNHTSSISAGSGSFSVPIPSSNQNGSGELVTNTINDFAEYGAARYGKTTDPRSIIAHLYQWGRTYTA